MGRRVDPVCPIRLRPTQRKNGMRSPWEMPTHLQSGAIGHGKRQGLQLISGDLHWRCEFRLLVHARRERPYRATLATHTLNRSIGGRGMMGRVVILVGNLVLGIVALLCGASGQVRAASPPQQFDAGSFQAATAKATEYCRTLWSDHAFDPLRDKIPLGGVQPTSSMLTNPQRVRPEDKPLVDLVLKTAEKCNTAFATALAMLPPPVHAKVLSVKRKGDTLDKQLSDGKITFSEYNVKRAELLKQMALAFASISERSTGETAPSAETVLEPKPLPSPKPRVQNVVPQTFALHEVRIALVIGESRYL